ncbi:MAG: adenylate/guanylate cyclase domain-containing protein [Bdellovibrionaceae bacterium]|nr:adenylate/guanylate cyclase domain-containing protein [Pseudobdellovibrionaceae bacterium]
MKFEKLPLLIGLLVSSTLGFFSHTYYAHRNAPDATKSQNPLLIAFETLDNRYNDIKYQIRGSTKTSSPVALIAIDDDSVREVGRWPWSRELIAQMTEKLLKYNTASIAFDVIFSEPERENPKADETFAAIVEKGSDRVILGTFSENEMRSTNTYQDFCINEAFKANQGDQIVKLNATLIIDDETDSFDDLDWSPFFTTVFSVITKDVTDLKLKKYNKFSVEDLHPFQRNALKLEISKKTFEYCREWLTDHDFTLGNQENENYFAKIYSSIFKPIKDKIKPPPPHSATSASVTQLHPSLQTAINGTNTNDWKVLLTRFVQSTVLNPIPQFGEWTPNVPVVQEKALYTASFVADQDVDGYVRRYPLFFRSGNRLGLSFIPSLALQSYLVAKGYRAEVKLQKKISANTKVSAEEKQITSFQIVDANDKKVMDIPVDSSGRTLINYYGKQMTLPYVPAAEIFSESEEMFYYVNQVNTTTKQNELKKIFTTKSEFFKGRSVIVGATAIGIYDLRTTPLEANYPGPEIHLTMLGNLFDNALLKYWPDESRYFPWVVFLFGVFITLIWSQLGAVSSFISLLVTIPLIFSVDLLVLSKLGLVFSGFLVLIILSFLTNFTITFYKYFTEELKKKQLKSTFSKYVSPAVVDEILKSDENLKLGGRRQRMSVFFSDVRGFTTISEKLAPEELSRVLNLYLTPMTEIVFANKGTLDKYIGDAIMAFFGAPIVDGNHAEQACRTALQSLTKLKELQQVFKDQNLPFIDIGIGINTGEMSVGNMGSNIVQNYTVMGDSVNLASRLEGTTKEYGVRIIINETTNEDIKGKFITREIDRVKVKGKNLPVAIFELLGEKKATAQDALTYLDDFEKGYQFYIAKDFKNAIIEFEKALTLKNDDPVSKIYIKRCTEFLEAPPPSDWDGVYVMKTK